jgi:WS/DGAT/MGAT family acyltransferase
MSFVDAAWLAMEDPRNLMMVTGVLILDGRPDPDRLRSMFEERLLRFDRFRQRIERPPLGLGMPSWRDDERFDLNLHMHRVALPEPADKEALETLVSDLLSTPLDLTKSPWQIHVVEYGPDTVLVARLHHSIADGIALMRVLLSLTDTSARPDRRRKMKDEKEKAATADPWRRAGEWLWTMGSDLAREPARVLASSAGVGAGAAATLAQLAMLPEDPPSVLKGPLGVAKRAVWSDPLPLPEIKKAGKRHGATVNDILLSAVAGGLRRYLLERRALEDGLEVRATVPVNLRPPDASPELGNRFGLVFLPLPLGIEDPLQRLREMHLRATDLKSSMQPIVAFGVLHALGMLPGLARDRAISFFGSKATAVITNVPGPQKRLYMAGRPLRQVLFWVPQAGRLGLGISMLSYANEVVVGVAADVGLVPDPERMVAAFHDELEQLLAL